MNNTKQQYGVVLIWLGSLGSVWVYGDWQALSCLGGAWHQCMGGAWHGVCWIGPGHWGLVLNEGCCDVIMVGCPMKSMHGPACPSTKTQIRPHLTGTQQDYMILLLCFQEKGEGKTERRLRQSVCLLVCPLECGLT